MEGPEANEALSFERAAYTKQAAGGPPCASCTGPLGEQYWQWQAKPFCASCREKLSELFAESQSSRAFGRAVLLGGLTALGSGLAYAAFVAVTHYQFALVTIGIAFLIAKVMRRSSGGIGGRKYQVLAVALTYLASSMGYLPWVYPEFRNPVALLAFTLVTPVLAAKEAPIGLLIVGFGLWEAWKLSRGLPLSLDGPYRAAPVTGPPAG